jgi:para-nitrobenzyl esterase
MTGPIAQIQSGKVEALAGNGVQRWLGVPYARAGRFAAPEPAEPWSGVRPAFTFGPECPQQFGDKVMKAYIGPPGFSEDCLTLNIYVPEGGAPSKPVLFWVHGGAFLAGSSNPYDGTEMAKLGDIVVVTLNYRLGVLGFVNFGEALGLRDIPSNLGLRDQVAALEWVRDNIAAFGGDPDNVTIAGQSAGSMSVSLLMLAPKARGLFHAAILQSGAVNLIHGREKSVALARRYVELLGVSQGDLARLRTMPLLDLLEARAAVSRETKGGIPAAPWYDDDLLPASLEAAHATPAAPVPLLAGATREETRLFELLPGGGNMFPKDWNALGESLRAHLPADRVERILAAYPRDKKGVRALATDMMFLMPTRNFAERHARIHPTWFYRFDYSHPVGGAAHALDLLFTWPWTSTKMMLVRGGPMTGARKALGDRMKANWSHFIRHHRPLDEWPAYTPGTRMVRLFDREDRIVPNPDAERFAAWGGHDVGGR